jgi:pyridoxamine 5'-phosphate oxidase
MGQFGRKVLWFGALVAIFVSVPCRIGLVCAGYFQYRFGIMSSANDNFTKASEPLQLFGEWLRAAEKTELNDANAMALASVDAEGMPNVRMVLLKDASEQGFVFYTNLESTKGCELLAQLKAALCFHWKSLHRQVRVRGPVVAVDDIEADAYFASRARASKIGAWASRQSRPLESRYALEKQVAKYSARFHIGEVPRPKHWSGFRLTPLEIEFWQDRPYRLHDRVVFTRNSSDVDWQRQRLYP